MTTYRKRKKKSTKNASRSTKTNMRAHSERGIGRYGDFGSAVGDKSVPPAQTRKNAAERFIRGSFDQDDTHEHESHL